MVSVLVAQVNLALQTAIFATVAVGFVLMRKRKINAHAQVMLAAVVLNIVSFIAIMGPNIGAFKFGDIGVSSIVAILHGFVGVLTTLLSVWVVGVWLVGPLTAVPAGIRCYGSLSKRLMLAVFFLWFASLILGVVLYVTLFG